MKNRIMDVLVFLVVVSFNVTSKAQETNIPSTGKIRILSNQVAYNLKGPKIAVLKSKTPMPVGLEFEILNEDPEKAVFSGKIANSELVADWDANTWYSRIDFSRLDKSGICFIRVKYEGRVYESYRFTVAEQAIPETAIPAIVNFFYHQRASSPQELEADSSIVLFGSNKTVDLRGGWCDASGDVSKYFSHLAYTNFMLPQQIPMVTWSMVNTVEKIPGTLKKNRIDRIVNKRSMLWCRLSHTLSFA